MVTLKLVQSFKSKYLNVDSVEEEQGKEITQGDNVVYEARQEER